MGDCCMPKSMARKNKEQPEIQEDPDKRPQRPDLQFRDPGDINDHLAVRFEDVIAEPEGAHSIDCVWKCSFRCFNGTKNCCYRTLTIFCGCFLAMIWGCCFASYNFAHIWCLTPVLRVLAINCGFLQKAWGTILQCFLAPVCETFGLCLSRIQITKFKVTDPDHKILIY